MKVGVPKVLVQDAKWKAIKMVDAMKLPEDVEAVTFSFHSATGYWKVTVEKL